MGRDFTVFKGVQKNLDNTYGMAYITHVSPYINLRQLSHTHLLTDPFFPFFSLLRLSR